MIQALQALQGLQEISEQQALREQLVVLAQLATQELLALLVTPDRQVRQVPLVPQGLQLLADLGYLKVEKMR